MGAGVVAHLCRNEVYDETQESDSKSDEEALVGKKSELISF